MKTTGQILQELGFNAAASDSAKEAFLRHLFKAATGVTVEPRNSEKHLSAPVKLQYQQLSFDLDDSATYKQAI